MATTSKADGSQTAVISTEHTLTTITDAGNYVLTVDADNSALGDVFTIRGKEKVRSTGTTRTLSTATYANVQENKVIKCPPIDSVHEVVYTLEQTSGTGRIFLWEVTQLNG